VLTLVNILQFSSLTFCRHRKVADREATLSANGKTAFPFLLSPSTLLCTAVTSFEVIMAPNRHGGRPENDWTRSRRRRLVRLCSFTNLSIEDIRKVLQEDGFNPW
jgi:hypothetical protein